MLRMAQFRPGADDYSLAKIVADIDARATALARRLDAKAALTQNPAIAHEARKLAADLRRDVRHQRL